MTVTVSATMVTTPCKYYWQESKICDSLFPSTAKDLRELCVIKRGQEKFSFDMRCDHFDSWSIY